MKCALVIEEDVNVRKNLVQILKLMNFTDIHESSHPVTAFKMFTNVKPELITIDISLSNNSGMDLLKQIKVNDKNTRIIVISPNNNKHLVAQACY